MKTKLVIANMNFGNYNPPSSFYGPVIRPHLSQSRTEVEYLLNRHFYQLASRDHNNTNLNSSAASTCSSAESSQLAPMEDSSIKQKPAQPCDNNNGKRRRGANEDPLSHRIIEKRRRDRMNNCLADLSRLIPSSYLKKGRGRIEKTEIIEMAIKHMKHLHTHSSCRSIEKCELASGSGGEKSSGIRESTSPPEKDMERNVESFRMGYRECLSEIMHFMVEVEGMYAGDSLCVRMMSHLQRHYEKLNKVKLIRPSHTESATASTMSDQPSVMSSMSSSSGYQSGSLGRYQTIPYHVSRSATIPSATESEASSIRKKPTLSETLEPSSVSNVGLDMTSEKLDIKPEEEEENYKRERTDSLHSIDKETGDIMKLSEYSQIQRDLDNPSQPIDEYDGRRRSHSSCGEHQGKSQLDSSASSDKGNEEGQGKYKFKANMRERFSHQHPLNVNKTAANKEKQLMYLNEMSSNSSSSSNVSEASAYGAIKRRKTVSAPACEDRDEVRGYDPKADLSSRSESPLKLLSFAASAMDTRTNQQSRHSSHSTSRGMEMSESNLLRTIPPHQSGQNVPIFALHPKGSYYIPLSIDYSMIASSLLVLTSAEDKNGGSVILHPITINVNFCGPVQMTINAASSSCRETSFANESPTNDQTALASLQSGATPEVSSDNSPRAPLQSSSAPYRHDYTPKWREKLDQILSPS